MIDSVRNALETGGHLLAEAPTGSGKTAASLHPALAHGLASRATGGFPDRQDPATENGRFRAARP